MKNISLLMFDLDGTLVDSKPDIVRAVLFALAENQLAPFPDDEIAKHIGYGLKALFLDLFDGEISEDMVDRLCASYKMHYQEHLTDSSQVFEVMKKVLSLTGSMNRAVITNKSRALGEKLLQKLGIFADFNLVYGGDSFDRMKPDPQPLVECCKALKVAPECALMIGDSEVDLIAARSAGCPSLIVKHGYGKIQLIKKLNPTYWLNEHELIEFFS